MAQSSAPAAAALALAATNPEEMVLYIGVVRSI
jgi:hypothetical protein